jgi:hypothetical protein
MQWEEGATRLEPCPNPVKGPTTIMDMTTLLMDMKIGVEA